MTRPALEHLMGAYLFEDWPEEYGSVDGAVSAFLTDNPDLARLLPLEIGSILRGRPSDDDLEAYLDGLGCAFTDPAGYCVWLGQLAVRLRDQP